MDKYKNSDSSKIANRVYDSKDYLKKDELSSGLATTHEQVSDAYVEGEIAGVIDDADGADIPLNGEEGS
jgi:hypothetical protein